MKPTAKRIEDHREEWDALMEELIWLANVIDCQIPDVSYEERKKYELRFNEVQKAMNEFEATQ